MYEIEYLDENGDACRFFTDDMYTLVVNIIYISSLPSEVILVKKVKA